MQPVIQEEEHTDDNCTLEPAEVLLLTYPPERSEPIGLLAALEVLSR